MPILIKLNSTISKISVELTITVNDLATAPANDRNTVKNAN